MAMKNVKSRLASSNSLEKTTKCVVSITSMPSSELLDREQCAGQGNTIKIKGGSQLKTESILGKESKFRDNIAETKVSQSVDTDGCKCPCHYTNNGNKVYEEAKPLDLCSRQDQDKEAFDLGEKTCNSAELLVSQGEDHVREVLILETVIVGRKFNRHAKVEKDMEIQAVREPENPKDENAIKVGPTYVFYVINLVLHTSIHIFACTYIYTYIHISARSYTLTRTCIHT